MLSISKDGYCATGQNLTTNLQILQQQMVERVCFRTKVTVKIEKRKR